MLKAVVYDFDGTLTPDALPKFAVLEKCGLENGTQNPLFLKRVKTTMSKNGIGLVDATIETILGLMREAGIPLTNEQLCLGAEDRIYNPGVEDFLAKLKKTWSRELLAEFWSEGVFREDESCAAVRWHLCVDSEL